MFDCGYALFGYKLLIVMSSKSANEYMEEKDEPKCGATLGNTGRMEQLYDKTTT